ncbi:MAG: 30S ribosomal protein S3 [Bacilli bacterium]|nr:30S ribosomal protein S3 [Bacilli bacterium]MDY4053178.1 30S ribosomal protein S3 [Bacilli bacterium]
MGQKVNPVGMRIGIIRDWEAKWYAPKTKVADLLHEDLKIREFLNNFYKAAYVSHIEIKRTGKRVIVVIHAAKPGIVIGTGGSKKNEAVAALQKLTGKNAYISVVEIKQIEADKDATIVARKMAEDLENRASFRRVQKMAIQKALKAGAKGIKTSISGRLGGAEIARSEGYIEGSVPLHTLRANIDYAIAEAATTYGKLGVKVWINKGEILPAAKNSKKEAK